jgi:hypothetical protein
VLRVRAQRVFSHLLAVTLVVCGSMPPGMCHAHADGDRPHRHDSGHHHAADFDHGHAHYEMDHPDHHASHECSHEHKDAVITEAVPHVHMNFFGFDWTLPISEPNSSDGRGEDSHELLFVAVAADQPASVRTVSHSPNDLSLLSFTHPSSAGIAIGEDQFSMKPTEACSIPLCDSARRERTGVLLI